MLATEPSGNADLGIEVILLDSGINVALEGELDLATAPPLREQLSELVAMGWIDITVDLAELQYIDSTGLSLLIRTQKRVEQTGGSLIVVHPTRATRRLLDTAGLTAKLMGTGRADDLIRVEGTNPA
jgi:anti-anti-sigma factor